MRWGAVATVALVALTMGCLEGEPNTETEGAVAQVAIMVGFNMTQYSEEGLWFPDEMHAELYRLGGEGPEFDPPYQTCEDFMGVGMTVMVTPGGGDAAPAQVLTGKYYDHANATPDLITLRSMWFPLHDNVTYYDVVVWAAVEGAQAFKTILRIDILTKEDGTSWADVDTTSEWNEVPGVTP